MTTTLATPPPPPPVHRTPLPALNISIVQPENVSFASIDPATMPTSKRTSYLGISSQQQTKRKSFLEYDSSCSSDSEGDDHRYSTESIVSEEHKFWQVHSSTTIIAPPSDQKYLATMEMAYVPRPRQSNSNKTNNKKQRISLAAQVRDILGNTLDDVDEEIEKEWENSRLKLRKSLLILPTISLSSSSV
jgi:hypothetical protein